MDNKFKIMKLFFNYCASSFVTCFNTSLFKWYNNCATQTADLNAKGESLNGAGDIGKNDKQITHKFLDEYFLEVSKYCDNSFKLISNNEKRN